MIKLKSELVPVTVSNLRGGTGDIVREELFSPDETFGKTTVCAVITIPDGSSIGEHPHGPDAELYYILSGSLRITDNGITKDLTAGDSVFTGDGKTHSVVNVSGKNATMLAVVVK